VDLNLNNNSSSVTINKIGEVLFFPTYFTPNGDGVNDNFVIRGLEDYPENEIFIFNRWGNEVFHSSTYMRGGRIWNGSNLSDGTYFYILNVVINGVSERHNGYITIIRGKK
jgi:gliding motility-associated-like protein